LSSLTFRKVDERAAVTRELVICRSDLPRNPKWSEEGLPHSTCWIVSRLPYRDREEFVLNDIVLEGLRLVPPEVREYTVKLYKELFGRS